MSVPTAMLHMIEKASQSVQPQSQGGKLTGAWNGSHGISSAWQERSAVFTAGIRYHQTQCHNAWIFHASDSKLLDCEFHSYRSFLDHQNLDDSNMQATADANGASFHPDVENYMVIEMR